MKKYILSAIIIVLISFSGLAQSTSEIGLLPTINLNKKLQKDWSLNFKTESRQSLIKEEFNYDYLLTDISFAASKKIGINTSIAMGYLIRVEQDGVKNRISQQITFVKRYSSLKLSHRLLSDQTFKNNDNTEIRFRYRLSSEIPLQGNTLDLNEFFLKISNEYLNSLYQNSYDLEIRGAVFLGYTISGLGKLELGLDYRLDSFIEGTARNRYWIGLNVYISF
jgi:hypothetical protein